MQGKNPWICLIQNHTIFAHLFTIGTHLIKRTSSYKVHSNFALNHFVGQFSTTLLRKLQNTLNESNK